MPKHFWITLSVCFFNFGFQMQDNFKLYFERSGGFAGMSVTYETSSEELAPDEKKKLISMMDSVRFFEFRPETESNPQPDRFQYTIVVKKGDSTYSVTLNESQLTEDWQPLIQYLSQKARMDRR